MGKKKNGKQFRLKHIFSHKPLAYTDLYEARTGLWERLKRLLRFNYLRILRLKTSAHSIALGAAFGILVGFLPIIPFQAVTVLTMAVIFRANKIAAFSFTFISNVANMIPFYTMLYMVGSKVLPFAHVKFDPKHLELMEMIKAGWDLVLVMSVGGLVLGIPSSIITYFVMRRLVLLYRRRRAMRLLKRRIDAP